MRTVFASIPSSRFNAVHIGPLQFRLYGMTIAVGVFAALTLAERRWLTRGGRPGEIWAVAVWSLPAGLIGARLYHVVTDFEIYRHDLWRAFAVWHGGLGIPGGIAAGVGVGLVVASRRGLAPRPLLDAVAPALALAQAIGRWGNWFNQELFGRPSSLPWAVRIDIAHRPAQYATASTFQPTFLYESMWNLGLVALLLVCERRFRLKPGRLFAVYVAGYAVGRFWIERLRVDFAHTIAGLRVNEWMSIVLFVGAVFVLLAPGRSEAATGEVHTHVGERKQTSSVE
jgi:prolipoprotein diacylglyceryl transferase